MNLCPFPVRSDIYTGALGFNIFWIRSYKVLCLLFYHTYCLSSAFSDWTVVFFNMITVRFFVLNKTFRLPWASNPCLLCLNFFINEFQSCIVYMLFKGWSGIGHIFLVSRLILESDFQVTIHLLTSCRILCFTIIFSSKLLGTVDICGFHLLKKWMLQSALGYFRVLGIVWRWTFVLRHDWVNVNAHIEGTSKIIRVLFYSV